MDDIVEDAAEKPKKVSSDAGSVETHDLEDLIAAERYLASKSAVKKRNRGLRFSQIVPPGAGD